MNPAKYDFNTRLMLGGAALLLLAVALLHGFGYGEITGVAELPRLRNPWREGLRGIWVVHSVNLLIVGTMLAYAALRPHAFTGPVLVLCGLFPAIDALLLIAFVGGFFANALLGLAAVLVFGAAARGTTPLVSHSGHT
jgi:hypothetical protein